MTHPLAATSTAAVPLIGALFLVALVVGALYFLACWWWPLTSCLRCSGDGKHRSPWGGSWRRCRRCNGSGERIRVGRRLWTRFTR